MSSPKESGEGCVCGECDIPGQNEKFAMRLLLEDCCRMWWKDSGGPRCLHKQRVSDAAL